MDVLGSANLSSVSQAIQSPTLAARPLSMQAGFWQRSPFSSAGLWSSVEKQRASVHGWGGDLLSPGPWWPPDQGTGRADCSILPSKEGSVLFSFKCQLICRGICLQSPFLCSSLGKLSRFLGGVLGNQLLPPSVPPEGGGNSVISWGPRLSKLFQAGPRGGRRGPSVQDALPSLVHQTQTL